MVTLVIFESMQTWAVTGEMVAGTAMAVVKAEVTTVGATQTLSQ